MRDVAAVLGGLLVAADLLFQRFHNGHVAAIIQGSLAVVAAVALWWRRSRPVVVAIVGIVVMFVVGVEYAAIVGIGTLMIRRRDRVSLSLTAIAVPAMIVGPRLNDIHTRVNSDNYVSSIFNALISIGVVAALGAYVGVRRDLLTSLQDRAERAEAEREIREEQGRLGERTRIAREMHDVLAHKVSLIALQAGGLEVTNDPTAEQVRASAALIRQTARQALEDLRDVLGVLRDHEDTGARFAPQPTLGDIAGLVESSRLAGQSVALSGTADLAQRTPDLVGRAAFRLVQEALTNVHKHARSAATRIRIDGAPGSTLDLEVVNLAPVAAGQLLPGSGLGLVGLRERIELVGGTFAFGPTRDGGFRVFASLPWPALEATATAGPTVAAPPAIPVPTAADMLR